MDDKRRLLQIAFIVGAVYFFAISIVHAMGLKVPGLYIYYNIPSLQYQDDIISFLSFGWAMFFYAASRHREFSVSAIVAAVVALLGIARINLTTDFTVLPSGADVTPFWIQLSLLSVYVGILVVLSLQYQQAKANH